LNKKNILLGNENYFELSIGKRILKKNIYKTREGIPIYSGSVITPFGFTDKSIIDDFDSDYIIWGIDDAVFDFAFIPKGEKFTVTDHCGVIKIINKKILPEYVFYELQLQKDSLGFGWTYRASLSNMKNVSISFPIKPDDDFDLSIQKSFASKSRKLRKLKNDLNDIIESLEDVKISVDENEIGNYRINDNNLFTIDNGGRITKKDVEKAKGNIPVYSSSKFENETLGYVSNNIKKIVDKARFFTGINLTVNADGSVGSVFVRDHKFYANDVCNVITIKHPDIDPFFVKYELRTQIYTMGLDWTNKLYKQKLRQISIRIPIADNGKFDKEKQKLLVKKYSHAEQLKYETLSGVNSLIEVKVQFEK